MEGGRGEGGGGEREVVEGVGEKGRRKTEGREGEKEGKGEKERRGVGEGKDRRRGEGGERKEGRKKGRERGKKEEIGRVLVLVEFNNSLTEQA